MYKKFTVDQSLMKTRSHEKNEDFIEAQEKINQLSSLLRQGHFLSVVEKAQKYIENHPKVFVIWNLLGAAKMGLGQVVDASKNFQKVIELNPNYINAYFNLGAALQVQGKLDQAIKFYKKSISLKPDYAQAFNNMGNALKDQGKLDQAICALKDALLIKPDYAEAHNNMGVALLALDRDEQAIRAFQKALIFRPNYAEAMNNIGVTLKRQSKLHQSISAYRNALLIKPNYPEAYNNMGLAFYAEGKFDEALNAFDKSITLKPDYAEAFNNIGMALQEQGKLGEAINVYKKSISLNPEYAEAYSNMGAVQHTKGKLDDAIDAFNKSISLKPDYAKAYNNMGFTLQDKGNHEKAIEFYKKSISLKPEYAEAHLNLGFTLLNNGKIKEGLEEYEWRWETKNFLSQKRHFSKPQWDGKQSLDGKSVLIWSEQGIGDTINWSSCLSIIASKTEHCILECNDKLIPLLKRSFPNIEISPENRETDYKRNDFDFHLPMGSLYKHFVKEILQNGNIAPFLVPDPARIKFWRKRLNLLGKGPYIGLSWKSSNISPSRLPNYASLSEWSPIFTTPDVTFINLQYKDYENDLLKIQNEFGITINNFDDLDHYNNIDDVAALCAALDVVISTKITVPLISSAVGTLTKLANWRQSSWSNILLNPLCSSVNIFERNTWESWNNVFQSIKKDISKINSITNSNIDEI